MNPKTETDKSKSVSRLPEGEPDIPAQQDHPVAHGDGLEHDDLMGHVDAHAGQKGKTQTQPQEPSTQHIGIDHPAAPAPAYGNGSGNGTRANE